MKKRTIIKIVFYLSIIISFVFITKLVNWNKLSYDNPITSSMIDIVLYKLDSNEVINHGVYNSEHKYYLKGDIITNTYKGGFFKSETIIDTCNTYYVVVINER